MFVKASSLIVRTVGIQQCKRAAGGLSLAAYRPKWPELDFEASEPIPPMPKRTVPEKVLMFDMTATMKTGTSIFYPHMDTVPGDLKVRLRVCVDHLELSPEETQVLIALVGPRFNSGTREIKLVTDRFPNRVENKRYATMLLEELIEEARKLNAKRHEYV